MHSNGEIFYIDQLILSPYTLFLVEEPQIPKNVQKVDTLVVTLQSRPDVGGIITVLGSSWSSRGQTVTEE